MRPTPSPATPTTSSTKVYRNQNISRVTRCDQSLRSSSRLVAGARLLPTGVRSLAGWRLRRLERAPVGHPCENCGKVYKHRGNMRRHMVYECGKQAMFSCSACDRKFHQQSNLKRHFENKHAHVLGTGCATPSGRVPQEFRSFGKSITVYRTVGGS